MVDSRRFRWRRQWKANGGGPNLLAMMLFEKFGQHQPLNRQAERYGREGVPLSLSSPSLMSSRAVICPAASHALISAVKASS